MGRKKNVVRKSRDKVSESIVPNERKDLDTDLVAQQKASYGIPQLACILAKGTPLFFHDRFDA